jgi:hypothetical protein
MAEVILNQAQIEPAIGEVKAAGVTQHMRMDRRQAGGARRDRKQIVDRLAGVTSVNMVDFRCS